MASTTQIRDAALAGQLARRLRQPETECPFARGTKLFEAWTNGWKRPVRLEPLRDAVLEEAIGAIDEAFEEDEDVSAQDVLRQLQARPAALISREKVEAVLEEAKRRAATVGALMLVEAMATQLLGPEEERKPVEGSAIPAAFLVSVAPDMPRSTRTPAGRCDHHNNPDCRHSADEILSERRPRPCPTGPDGVPCEPMPGEPTRCVYGEHPMPGHEEPAP